MSRRSRTDAAEAILVPNVPPPPADGGSSSATVATAPAAAGASATSDDGSTAAPPSAGAATVVLAGPGRADANNDVGAAGADHGQAGNTGATAAPEVHRHTFGMWISVVVFWLLAMPVGVLGAIIVAGRRARLCSRSASGFGCTSTGSAVGVALLAAVVVAVGTVSVYAYDARRSPRRWAAVFGVGIGVLAVAGVVAWLIVRSIH